MKTLKQAVETLRGEYYARALHLLESTNLTLAEVAKKTGISPRSVFMLAVKHEVRRPLRRSRA